MNAYLSQGGLFFRKSFTLNRETGRPGDVAGSVFGWVGRKTLLIKSYFMKTIQLKALRATFAAALIAFTLVACDKDGIIDNNNGDPVYSTTAQASGSQTTPPTTTSGTATLVGEYNARTNNWEYRINWNSLTSAASAIQIHGPATVGSAAEMQVALAITTPGITGKAEGNVTLTEQQEAYLIADQLYFTIINATSVNGEVRGQIQADRVK